MFYRWQKEFFENGAAAFEKVSKGQREREGREARRAILDEAPAVKPQRSLTKKGGKRESWVSDMFRILTLPAALQQELRKSEAVVPYDAVMRISRVEHGKLQKHLVKDVLDSKPNREHREKFDGAKGRKALAPAPIQKPVAKVTDARKDQSCPIGLPSATVTVNFKKGPVSTSAVKATLLQALEILG